MLKENKKTIFRWSLVLFWMILIFFMSSQPAVQSDGVSRNVTKMIIEAVVKIIPLKVDSVSDMVTKLNHAVRKSAHFFLYFMLGIFTINAAIKSKVKILKALKFSALFCVFYAMSDEFHQLFVQGRGCQFKDVVIDAVGASCGILLCILYKKFLNIKTDNLS